jgi:hypothetical protein
MGRLDSAVWAGFTKVAPETGYTGERGYGWLEAPSRLSAHVTTELDALSASDVSGCVNLPVNFRVDVRDGDYTVWVLTGAMGNIWRLRYLRAPHDLLLQGRVVEHVEHPEEEVFRCANYDWRKGDDVYRIFVAPRFSWMKHTVTVTDGKLIVGFAPGEDFPVNAIVVARDAQAARVEEELQAIDGQREETFNRRWQLLRPEAPPRAAVSSRERRRGYVLAQVDTSEDLDPWSQAAADANRKRIEVIAAPGEEEQASFAVYGLKDLQNVEFRVTDLRRNAGGMLPRTGVRKGLVQFLPWQAGHDRRWFVFKEALILPERPTFIGQGTCKRFWLRLRVPVNAMAGMYRGRIEVSAANAGRASLRLLIRVVPVKLRTPPIGRFMYFGSMYYLSRAYMAEFDEDEFWESMRAEVRFLKENGFSRAECILPNNIGSHLKMQDGKVVDVDLSDTERLMQIIREEKAWPPDNTMVCRADALVSEFGGHFWRPSAPTLAFIPTPEGRDNFRRAIQIIRAKAQQAGWPQVVFEVGGEYSNFGEAGKTFCVEAEAALRKACVPNTLRGNGAMDMAAVYDGLVQYPQPNWAMMRTEWLDFMKRTSTRVWGYNYTRSRYAMGWFTFKHGISRVSYEAGIYANGQPGNVFDTATDFPLALPTSMTTIEPTVWLKQLVEGELDFKYLYTLDESIRAAEDSGTGAARRIAGQARAWLGGKLAEIPDGVDYRPSDPCAEDEVQGRFWPRADLDRYRLQMGRFIMALERAMTQGERALSNGTVPPTAPACGAGNETKTVPLGKRGSSRSGCAR